MDREECYAVQKKTTRGVGAQAAVHPLLGREPAQVRAIADTVGFSVCIFSIFEGWGV